MVWVRGGKACGLSHEIYQMFGTDERVNGQRAWAAMVDLMENTFCLWNCPWNGLAVMQEFNESTNGRCEKPDVDVRLRLLTCQQKALRKLHHVSSCVSIQLISMNIQNMTKNCWIKVWSHFSLFCTFSQWNPIITVGILCKGQCFSPFRFCIGFSWSCEFGTLTDRKLLG